MDIGIIAGILTTSALIPQVIKAYRTKDVGAISLAMYCVQLVGIVLWIFHGLRICDTALILANVVTLCLSGSILAAKLKFGKTEKQK